MSTQPEPFPKAEIDPSIEQDPISLLHYWVNLPDDARWQLATELELRLLALQASSTQQLIETTDEIAIAIRDLVEIFKLRK